MFTLVCIWPNVSTNKFSNVHSYQFQSNTIVAGNLALSPEWLDSKAHAFRARIFGSDVRLAEALAMGFLGVIVSASMTSRAPSSLRRTVLSTDTISLHVSDELNGQMRQSEFLERSASELLRLLWLKWAETRCKSDQFHRLSAINEIKGSFSPNRWN